MRTRPYRNPRIIAVLRDLYFSGGTSSFAHRFRRQFPVHESDGGTVMREMPVPMVALVATAVSTSLLMSDVELTLQSSSTLPSKSGERESTSPWISRQTHILMFTMAMSTRSPIFVRIAKTHFILWCVTFTQRRGGYDLYMLWQACWSVCRSMTVGPTWAAIAELELDNIEAWSVRIGFNPTKRLCPIVSGNVHFIVRSWVLVTVNNRLFIFSSNPYLRLLSMLFGRTLPRDNSPLQCIL